MIALLTLLLANYSAGPAPPNHFTLEVEKTGVMKGKKHVFRFPKYLGTLQYDAKSPANSKVEFTLDGASMVNEDDWVKESDREKILEWGLNKMIEVKQHPEIRFVSDHVNVNGPNRFNVSGALTMRGVSRPAVIAVTTQDQGRALKLEGSSTVNMKDWGMKPPTAALGAVGTKPEMQVRFQLFFTPSK